MRKLNTADIFKAARAVKSSGLREEIKKMTMHLAKGDGSLDVEAIGVDTILQVIECFADNKAEAAVYDVLAGPFEVDAGAIPEMDLSTLMGYISQLAKDPGLTDFFRLVSGGTARS